MSRLIQWIDETFYPGILGNWDDALFRDRILSVIQAESEILDLGAGAGIVPHMNFLGRVRRVCGVDPDARIADNPYLDDARIGTGEAIPYPDSCFDLVFADNVAEHLVDPVRVFREVARVLRKG